MYKSMIVDGQYVLAGDPAALAGPAKEARSIVVDGAYTMPPCESVCPGGLARAGERCALLTGHAGPHEVAIRPGNPFGSTWNNDGDVADVALV